MTNPLVDALAEAAHQGYTDEMRKVGVPVDPWTWDELAEEVRNVHRAGVRAVLRELAAKRQFAVWLRNAMQSSGFTSDLKLANELGINHSTVGRWVKGLTVPDIPTLRKLSWTFNQPLALLLVMTGHVTADELTGVSEVCGNCFNMPPPGFTCNTCGSRGDD